MIISVESWGMRWTACAGIDCDLIPDGGRFSDALWYTQFDTAVSVLNDAVLERLLSREPYAIRLFDPSTFEVSPPVKQRRRAGKNAVWLKHFLNVTGPAISWFHFGIYVEKYRKPKREHAAYMAEDYRRAMEMYDRLREIVKVMKP